MTNTNQELRTGRAVALYVGALLGPGLLLMPGLAAGVAGPASIVAWGALLVLSAGLAAVFSALGSRAPSAGGAAGYAAAAFGPRAARAVRVCFVAGVVCGAPVVCLVGGDYVAGMLHAGRTVSVGVAAGLLLVVTVTALGGARLSSSVQLVFVAVLLAVVVLATVVAAPHGTAAHWAPFAPHGWAAVGSAAALLMFCFVGWEAIAPLSAQLRNPRRQLPRVIAVTFVITSVVFLGLGAATVGVVGHGTRTPIADLLAVALGRAGTVLSAVAAVVLTLAAVNAYLSGAAGMIADGTTSPRRWLLPLAITGSGVLVLGGQAVGVPVGGLVSVPTAMFVLVYVVSTAAAARLIAGRIRVVAVLTCATVVVMLVFTGWPALLALAVAAVAAVSHRAAKPAVSGKMTAWRPSGSTSSTGRTGARSRWTRTRSGSDATATARSTCPGTAPSRECTPCSS